MSLVSVLLTCVVASQAAASVHYIGRFTDEPLPRFAWPGSGVVATFRGTGIAVRLGGAANVFETFIDGVRAHTIAVDGDGVSVIADKLSPGEHRVEVYRRTEAVFGPSTFGGFAVAGGDLVPSPLPFARRLQFVGDSITCGYGNLGELASSCHLEGTTEDETRAFAALTARALGAAHHAIAWSGKGMYRQYGHVEPTPLQMPELYERTLPSEATPWDHQRYVPDVVVVNLGTNDWWKGDPGDGYFNAYVGFVMHLRALYPEAHIVCVMGSMQNSGPAVQQVRDVVALFNDPQIFADTGVHFVELAAQEASDGFGCDYHPSALTQQKMAEQLTAALRTIMGW